MEKASKGQATSETRRRIQSATDTPASDSLPEQSFEGNNHAGQDCPLPGKCPVCGTYSLSRVSTPEYDALRAELRQIRLERWGSELEKRIVDYGDKLQDKIRDAHNLIRPDGAHVDNTSPLNPAFSTKNAQHLAPKAPSRLSQISGRQATASVAAVAAMFAPVAPAVEAKAAPIPAIAPAPSNYDIDRLPIEQFRSETMASPNIEAPAMPATIETPGMLDIHTGLPVQEPLVRTLHQGDGVVAVAKDVLGEEGSKDLNHVLDVTRNLFINSPKLAKYPVPATLEDLDDPIYKTIPAGTELVIPIETANREKYIVRYGDKPADVYRALGWADEHSYKEFVQGNVLADPDRLTAGNVVIGPPPPAVLEPIGPLPGETPPANPTPPNPEQPDNPILLVPPASAPVRPPEEASDLEESSDPVQIIAGPPNNEQFAETVQFLNEQTQTAGQIFLDNNQIMLENSRSLSQTEAETALDLLIAATINYENPLHDLPVPPQENEPTPEADRLKSLRDQLAEELADGDTNLAFIQSETLRHLATGPDGKLDQARMVQTASRFIRFIAERNGWVVIEEETAVLADLLIQGATPTDYGSNWSQREAASTAGRFDNRSLTLELYEASLEGHLEEQVELARLAERQLEMLRPQLRDLTEQELQDVAHAMIMTRRSGQPVNDYSYEVLNLKLGEHADPAVELKLLGRQLFAARDSEDLLELFPSAEQQVADTVDGWLNAEGEKSLTALMEQINIQLDERGIVIQERGQQLQELSVDLEELNPDLIDLDAQQLYELSKYILAAEEAGQSRGDDWHYLFEAKLVPGQDPRETLSDLVAGVYRAQGADLLLSASASEQEAVASAVDAFLASEGPFELKKLLDAQFNGLEERLVAAESSVAKVIETVGKILSDQTIDETELQAMSVRKLLGQTDQALAEELIGNYTEQAGRQLTGEETARIDIEMIKAFAADEQTKTSQIAEYLLKMYGQQGAAFYLSGADDPAILTLSRMLAADDHTVNYPEGEMSIFSETFLGKLRAYDTRPNSLFPGTQWLIRGYGGQDLRPYFSHMGLDAEAILANPYNSRLKLVDGRIVADSNGAIWFEAALWEGKSTPDFEAAADWVYGEIPGFKYTAEAGDTLSAIANKFRGPGGAELSWEAIVEWNRGRISDDPAKLQVGQLVVIPEGYTVYIEPIEAGIELPEINSGGTNYEFEHTGQEIKDELQAQAPDGESGHLSSEHLDALGPEWGGHSLYPDAAEAFRMLATAFEAHFGKPLELTDSYRNCAQQEALYEEKPDLAAEPCTSNHGWGLAIDFASNINQFGTPEHEWMREHAVAYGWELPGWAYDGKGKEEPWHWEYRGRPAESVEGQPGTVHVTTEMVENISEELNDVSADVVRDFARRTLAIAQAKGIELTPVGLAAYMAHISSESDFKPSAVGDNGHSFGIFQAQGGRDDGLPKDLDGQIAFSFDDMVDDGSSMGYDLIGAIQDPNATLEEVVETGFDWLRPQAHLDGNDGAKQHRFDRATQLFNDMNG